MRAEAGPVRPPGGSAPRRRGRAHVTDAAMSRPEGTRSSRRALQVKFVPDEDVLKHITDDTGTAGPGHSPAQALGRWVRAAAAPETEALQHPAPVLQSPAEGRGLRSRGAPLAPPVGCLCPGPAPGRLRAGRVSVYRCREPPDCSGLTQWVNTPQSKRNEAPGVCHSSVMQQF